MNRSYVLSIRAKLLLLALILILPSFGIIIYSGISNRNIALQRAFNEVRQLAAIIASEHQHLANASRQMGSLLARLPEVQDMSGSHLSELSILLADTLNQNHQYLNILVADRDGMVKASALPFNQPFSVDDRLYYKKVVQTGKFSSGEFIIGKILPEPALSFAYPIKNNKGSMAGLVILSINLRHIESHLATLPAFKNVNLTLTDHAGIVMFRHTTNSSPEYNRQYVGKPDYIPVFHRMQQGPQSGEFTTTGFDGSQRFLAYQKVTLTEENNPYLFIRTSLFIKDAQLQANRALLTNIVAMNCLVTLSIIFSWIYSSRSIVRRLTELESIALQLSGGNLGVMIDERRFDDELDRLGQTFNLMSAQLTQRIREQQEIEWQLRQSRTYLTEAEALAHLGNFSWDLQTGAMIWSDEMYRLMGYKPGVPVVSTTLFEQTIHIDDRAQIRKLFENMADYSDYAEYGYRVYWPDGSLRHLLGRSTVIRDDGGMPVRIQGTAQDVTEQVIIQHQLIEYHETLQALTDDLAQTRERERHEIASELHDNIAQTLALCSIRLSAPNLHTAGDEQSKELNLIRSRLDQAINGIRSMITRINTPVLQDMGLTSALESLVDTMRGEWGLQVNLNTVKLPDAIPYEQTAALFQIIRELLTNVAKHAQTTQAWLTLRMDGTLLVIQVDDQGIGFDPDSARRGFGLFSISQKVHKMGGRCTTNSGINQGAHTIITVPLAGTQEFPSYPAAQ